MTKNSMRLLVSISLALVGVAWGEDSAKTWEWALSTSGSADYGAGANWVGGVAPANYARTSATFLDNKDMFVFTNELEAAQTINVGSVSTDGYLGWQFGSLVLDRFHSLSSPKQVNITITDASRMEGFVRTRPGIQNDSSANSGPVLKIAQGVTNRLAQVMIQDYAKLSRYGDDLGGVAEFGKVFGVGTFNIGGESYEKYKLLGSPSYLFDSFETGVQGHLRAGERAPVVIKGHATDAAIAAGAYLHLDAVAAGTVGGDFTWRDADGGSVIANPVGAPTWGTSVNGLPTIVLAKGSAYELSEDITGVREVFIVFRDLDPGTSKLPPPLLGDYTGVGNFARNTTKDYEYLFASGTAATKYMDAGEVWYDGSRVLPDFCGSFGGQFHVVSVMLYGGTGVVGCLGAAVKNAASDKCGQVAFAEVVVYKRTLTDAERRATNLYLRKKWQSADLAYDWDLGSYNVLSAVGDTRSIAFESGTTAIRELRLPDVQTSFVKKGEGRLEIGRMVNEAVSIEVEQGSLAVVRPEAPVACEMASDPIAWFDPSDERDNGSLTPDPNDATRVSRMVDYRKTNNKTGQLPTAENAKNWNVDGISPLRVADTPTGLMALDFGVAATSAQTFEGKSSRMKITGNPAMREGFVVWKKNADACGAPFSDNTWKFFGVSANAIIDPSYCMAAACGGYWTINGEQVAGPSVSLPTGEYMVVALRPSAGFFCTYLGSQRGSSDTNGGCSYGELILYDRVLTPAERRNTEAYLMKKWLNKDHPMAVAAKMTVPSYAIETDAENTIETDADMTIGSLVSAHGGAFVKKGVGVLKSNLPAGTSAIIVEGGSIESEEDIASLFRDAAGHFDASDDASFIYEGDDSTKVLRWNDCRYSTGGSQRSARLLTTWTTNAPSRIDVEINGTTKTVVDFGEYCRGDKSAGNVSTNLGSRLRLYNGEKEESQYQLREFYIVRRDTEEAEDKRAAILAAQPYQIDRDKKKAFLSLTFKPTSYTYTVDGSECPYNTEIDTGWHVHCLTTSEDWLIRQNNLGGDKLTTDEQCYGGIQIAELVTFTTPRSENDRQAIIDYLRKKWMGETHGAMKEYESVSVASGATVKLNLAGWGGVSMSSLSGNGSVDFGVPVSGIDRIEGAIGADGVAHPMTLAGAVTLAETGVVKASCSNAKLKSGFYPILSASEIVNPDAITGWKLELSAPLDRPAKLEVRNGQLGLFVKPFGLVLIVK